MRTDSTVLSRRDVLQAGAFTGIGPLLRSGGIGSQSQQLENRLKIFLVDPIDILQLFYGPMECLAVAIDKPELPKDAKVVGVDFGFDPRCFRFMVWSSEFESVPLGERVPIVPGLAPISYKAIRKQDDGSYR
jgi:hypothetical protein